ncbi:MAG: hypothetical protein Q4C10_03310 [Clostridia bacterium]|nr:hypothetical protein [Clostridia bacterium]
MSNQVLSQAVREARSAGVRALNNLRDAQRHLERARGWGIYDLLGGGMLASIAKHSAIGDAQHCVELAQDDLNRFWRDNARVDMPYVQIGSLLSFSDVFLDGLLPDLLAQRKINDARDRLEKACRRLEEVLASLPNPSEV